MCSFCGPVLVFCPVYAQMLVFVQIQHLTQQIRILAVKVSYASCCIQYKHRASKLSVVAGRYVYLD